MLDSPAKLISANSAQFASSASLANSTLAPTRHGLSRDHHLVPVCRDFHNQVRKLWVDLGRG